MSDAPRKKEEVEVVVSGGERPARKKHHFSPGHPEYHEGAPEWLISFADMVMLMMGFFVILFALNFTPKQSAAQSQSPDDGSEQQPTPDMIDFAIAVRKAFNNEVDLASTNPKDKPLIDRILARQSGAGEARDEGEAGREREVRSIRPAPRFGTGASVIFADQSAELTAEDAQMLASLARNLRGLQSVIEVRGHASASEAFREPERAMRLGFERGFAVAEILAREGVQWRRLRVTSEGDHDRVAPFPRDPADDRRNARAEILVLDQVAGDPIPTRPTTAGSPDASGNDSPESGPLPGR